MKRAAIITAAAAYTIAAADDAMAGRIAAEVVSNASGRLGHQLARGLEEMKRADAATFPGTAKRVRGYIEASARNERATLDSVLQLAADKTGFGAYLAELKASVTGLESAHLKAMDNAMRREAAGRGLKPVDLKLSDAEKKAAALVPKPLPKVREGGYQGYQAAIQEARKALGAAVIQSDMLMFEKSIKASSSNHGCVSIPLSGASASRRSPPDKTFFDRFVGL